MWPDASSLRGAFGIAAAPTVPATRTVVMVSVTAVLVAVGIAVFIANPLVGLGALGLPLVPLVVLAPEYAVLLPIATLPLDEADFLVPDDAASVTKLLTIAVLAGWMMNVLIRRQHIRIGAPGYLLIAYTAFALLSATWSVQPTVTIVSMQTIVQLLVFYLMLTNVLNSTTALRRALDVLIAATCCLALLVIWERPAIEDFAHSSVQIGAQALNHNYLAVAVALPALAAVALGRSRGAFGWWRWAAVALSVVATLLTGSRGGIITMAGGLLILGIANPRRGLAGLLAAVVLCGLVLATLPQAYGDRLSSRFTNATEDRLSGRFDIWKVGAQMIADRPLLGTGFGGFELSFRQYMDDAQLDPQWALANVRGGRAAHNIYLKALAELGLVGLLIFLAAIGSHALSALKSVRRACAVCNPGTRNLALAILAMFAGVLVAGLNTELTYVKSTWFFLATAQAIDFLTRQPTPGNLR